MSDVSGNAMPAAFQFSITVRGAFDSTGPLFFTNANRSLGLPRDVGISLAFTEPLEPASVTASTVYFADNGNPLPTHPTLDPSGRYILLTPIGSLPAEAYLQVLVDGVADVNGNLAQAADPASNYFGTGTALTDDAPPAILRFQPLDGATSVPINVMVDAKLSEPLDPFSFGAPFLEVRDGNGNLVQARTPLQYQAPLAPNTTYTMTTKAAKDYAGKPLATQSAMFTTSNVSDNTAPLISSQYPTPQAMGIPANVSIILSFSEPVAAENVLLRITNPFADVPSISSLSNGGQTLTIQPLAALVPGRFYSVYMYVMDFAGNGLNGAPSGYYAFSFTTAGSSPLTDESLDRLQVLHVNPRAGSVEATNGLITLTLSDSLDPASLSEVFLASDGQRVSAGYGALTEDGRTVELMLNGDSQTDEIAVILSDRARSVSGRPALPFERLLASKAATESRVRLLSVRPPPGSRDVASDVRIFVSFSDALDWASAPSSIEVLADGRPVSGTISLLDRDRILVFTPDLAFANGANVSVRARQDMLRAADGSRLEPTLNETFFEVSAPGPERRPFAARPANMPEPVAAWPSANEADIAIDAEIIVRFEGAIGSYASRALALRLRDSDETTPCRISVQPIENGFSLIVTPHQLLDSGATYELVKDPGAETESILTTFTTRVARLPARPQRSRGASR